jgi:glycosyltransferase involved in cell wall biosynthesis
MEESADGATEGQRRARVAIVLDTVTPWSKGGRERRMNELLNRLGSEFDLAVYTMRWWRQRPRGAIAYHAISPRLRLYVGERRSILQALAFAIGSLQLLFRRFDVIVADHMPYLHLFPLRIVAWIRRVPLVIEWHEFWGRDYWEQYLGPAGRVGATLEAWSLRLGDEVVADGDALASTLREILAGDREVVTISNAVSSEQARSVVAAEDAPELLFVGRLVPHKRADVAVEALAALDDEHRHVRLGVIGVGPELEHLRELAQRLGVDQRVEFLGSIEHHERVWSLLRGADVFLAPSEREGFGLAVAEALAVGTPTITVSAAGNEARTFIDEGRTGSVVPPGDPDAMAVAITHWLETRPQRDQLGAAFWSTHADLDWAHSAAKYAQLLRDVGSRRCR